MAGVFSFMKTLDPTSVVREAEYEAAASSAGLGAKATNILDRLTKGKVLTEQQAEDFKKIAFFYIEGMAEDYDRTYDDMVGAFGRFGIPEDFAPTRASKVLYDFVKRNEPVA